MLNINCIVLFYYIYLHILHFYSLLSSVFKVFQIYYDFKLYAVNSIEVERSYYDNSHLFT